MKNCLFASHDIDFRSGLVHKPKHICLYIYSICTIFQMMVLKAGSFSKVFLQHIKNLMTCFCPLKRNVFLCKQNKGLEMFANCSTNFLYYPAKPRNCLTSLRDLGGGMSWRLFDFSDKCSIFVSDIKWSKYRRYFLKKGHLNFF